ncbi:MAG: decaprenyl-phosphate phosphoribosyltransferase [Acidimicrobiales bacterium]
MLRRAAPRLVDSSQPPVPAVADALEDRGSTPKGLWRSLRPRQWTKNVLVFVAPAAAGTLGHAGTAGQAIGAFAIFAGVASGLYLLNDVMDVEADRLHPQKQRRPIASGAVGVIPALSLGATLLVAGLVGAWLLAGWRLLLVMALYAAVSAAYSIWVKYLPVVELASVASGFVLRAIAGGVAASIPLSDWFLAVISFSALFIVIGKRLAEHSQLGTSREMHRAVLGQYTTSFLKSALVLTATASVTTYCLWAFDRTGLGATHPGHNIVWIQLTVVPFVIAVLHVLRILDAGGGSAPEELALKDRWLQVFGAFWLLFFLVGIYA